MCVNGARLPDDLVKLVTHVELNQTGWWDRALDRLVLALVASGIAATEQEIATALSPLLRAELAAGRVATSVSRLTINGQLSVFDGRLGLDPSTSDQLRSLREQAERDEADLQSRFLEDCVRSGLDVDPVELWHDINELFIDPIVRSQGVRLYEVLSHRGPQDDAYPDLLSVLETRYSSNARPVLSRFLDPNDHLSRRFLLRKLNAEFLRDAAGLPTSTLQALAKRRPGGVHRVLLDSNLVFSILGLSDPDSNELASSLLSIANKSRSEIPTKFLVLPITVDEIKRTLRAQILKLQGVYLTPQMASGARTDRSNGLVDRYLQARAQSSVHISAESYFGPYEDNLLTILEDKGISLLNDPLDSLRVHQRVIDGIHDLQDSQQGRITGPKPYEANLHDMVLWVYASQQLPAIVESPLDGRIWVATLDKGLLFWDRRHRSSNAPPLVVSPSDLTQLLAFFVPRDEQYERALVESLREPLLFMDFDPEAESTTVAILSQLSKYEKSSTFSVDTIRSIVFNAGLRARLEQQPRGSGVEAGPLVRDAIVSLVEQNKAEAIRAQAERDSFKVQLERMDLELTELRSSKAESAPLEEPLFLSKVESHEASPSLEVPFSKAKSVLALLLVAVFGLGITVSFLIDGKLSTTLEIRNRLLVYALTTVFLVAAVAHYGLRAFGYKGRELTVVKWIVRVVGAVWIVGLVLSVLGNDLFTDLRDGKAG